MRALPKLVIGEGDAEAAPKVKRGPLAFAPAPIVGAAGRAAWTPGRDRRGAWARRDLW